MSEHDPLPDPPVDLREPASDDDEQAEARLPEAVHAMVRRYCRARLATVPSGAGLADEVAAEITSSLRRDHRVALAESPSTEAVVYPVMADAVRRVLDGLSASTGARITAGGGHPAGDVRQDLVARIDRLPPRCREVLVLRAFVGLSTEQTGRAMGLTAKRVRTEQERALARLRSRQPF